MYNRAQSQGPSPYLPGSIRVFMVQSSCNYSTGIRFSYATTRGILYPTSCLALGPILDPSRGRATGAGRSRDFGLDKDLLHTILTLIECGVQLGHILEWYTVSDHAERVGKRGEELPIEDRMSALTT